MKKILLFLIAFIVAVLLAGLIYVRYMSEEKPEPKTGNADALAYNMLDALNQDAWDKTKYLTWTFRDDHHYHWDKVNNNAIIAWDDYEVYMNLDKQTGTVLKKGQKVTDEEALQTAWSYWCNDSFWMFAPFKVFDPGTKREVMKSDSSAYALMVTYDSGGVTPGDAYLWLLDENYRPTGYKMWVKIIPLKGMYSSWDKWKQLNSGAWVSTYHTISVAGLEMNDVQDGESWEAIGKEHVDESLFL